MAELPADLAEAVKAQAQARVEMNIQGYAKYLTPEAVDSLRASFPGIPPRVREFEIGNVAESGGDYMVDIVYAQRGDRFVVRSKWRKQDGAWLVAHAERLWAEGDKRPGPVSRIAGRVLRLLARLRR